jgi:hypothetical protein
MQDRKHISENMNGRYVVCDDDACCLYQYYVIC